MSFIQKKKKSVYSDTIALSLDAILNERLRLDSTKKV